MKQKIKYFWSKLQSKRKLQLFWLFFLTVVTSILEAVSIGAVIPFLGALTSPEILYENENILPVLTWLSIEDSQQLLPLFSLIFAVLILISGALRVALLWAQTRISFAIGVDLDEEIYKNILHKPYSEHLTNNSSKLISSLTIKTSQVVTQLIIPSLLILSSSLILSAILLLLIMVNPVVAIMSLLGFGLIYVTIYLVVRNNLKNSSRRISSYQDRVVKIIQESIGGIRDILIDGLQPVFHKAHLEANLTLKRALGNNQIIANAPRFAIEAISMALVIIIANIFINNSGNGIVEVLPILGLVVLSAQRVLPVLQQIFSSISQIKGVNNTAEDVVELLRKSETHGQCNEKILKLSTLNFKHCIVLNNVSYRYSSNEPWIFKNLNFEFTKGEKIGIIGKTGSGKSTLIDILIGLLPPTKGRFMIDNKIIRAEDVKAWQKHIAHVPQTIFLLDATISENIAFGLPLEEINHSLVQQVAKSAQISDSIELWKEGYNTMVGENGIRLSGGQRQRIGIARALYKKSGVIIFDEATSALDSKTEEDVMKAIRNLDDNITILIIAHRLTTLEGCDRIININKMDSNNEQVTIKG
jgi:ATP-binding cassette, subfamily B, bacterial PglK